MNYADEFVNGEDWIPYGDDRIYAEIQEVELRKQIGDKMYTILEMLDYISGLKAQIKVQAETIDHLVKQIRDLTRPKQRVEVIK